MATCLHYRRYGMGPRVVLAFHGHGQEARHWLPLLPALGPDVSVLAFDLFYHGRSQLAPHEVPLSKQRLGQLVADILRQEQVQRFGLLAFSMGARFACTVLEQLPNRVEQLWLIAPDGLQPPGWYALATSTAAMRGVLGRAVRRPQVLLAGLAALVRWRLIPESLGRFARWHLDSRAKRLRVYRSWVGFRQLTFRPSALRQLLARHAIPVTVFLARHDPVIPPAGLQRWVSRLPGARSILLASGHGGLIQRVAAYVRQHPEAGW